ncbi:uncharacterized protein LOC131332829 [Rhododendron vialii]|uniref:uncharacterized protein LOC131332829 n=1 Tax=Rhododendron vialii TaxID=182163 RepID=UPI0026603A1B|nr:uncharacterized protein LOC131332829 [Rhododendron vialii]
MEFKTHSQFRDAVKEYAIKHGKHITFTKSDREKVRAICKTGCPWDIYASYVHADAVYRVKTYNSERSCTRSFDVPWKAYRARKKALEVVQGKVAKQYGQLWGYMEEIKNSNPGTTIKIQVKPVAGFEAIAKFKRLYICWGALKRGFQMRCRPIIGLDDCHLKGPYGGILLTAVGIDANNQIYPFSYAVVEIEKYKTWHWFLELLGTDLNIQNTRTYTLMSDKQKGLIEAVKNLYPNAEHRFCVRHLYNNFKQDVKGLVLKEILWRLQGQALFRALQKQCSELYKSNGGDERDRYCNIQLVGTEASCPLEQITLQHLHKM